MFLTKNFNVDKTEKLLIVKTLARQRKYSIS